MNLNKENLKKIRGLIVFTVILLIALWNYSLILDVLGQGVGIVYPFLLGGAIAFVINVPMSFFEEKLFQNQMMKNKKVAQRLARPVSLIITLIVVVSVIGLVVFGVLPKLGDTFISIGKGIQSFMPKAQSWAEEIFHNNKEIKEWLDSLTLDWDKIINEVVKFFTSGASSVLGSTFVVARRIASGITTFVIAFVFACYILLQKEKLNIQIRKVMYAYMKEDLVKKVLDVCSLSYRTFSNFLTGQCLEAVILGTMFVICMGILQMPYAMLIGVLIAFTALIPIFGSISDPDGGADEGFGFCDHVPDSSTDRGKSDLSESGGQFCGTSVYLGAGSGQYRSQSDGNRGNAGFHSNRFRAVCTSPWGCL